MVNAIEHFYQDHHDYPSQLKDLTPRYLRKIPENFLSNGEWKYVKIPTGVPTKPLPFGSSDALALGYVPITDGNAYYLGATGFNTYPVCFYVTRPGHTKRIWIAEGWGTGYKGNEE